MGTTIDQLEIEVVTQSDKASKGLDKLKETLTGIKKISKSSGLDKVCAKLEKIASLNFSNLAPLEKLSKTTGSLGEMSDKIKDVTSAIGDVPSEIGTTVDVGGISDTVSEIESATAAINDIPKTVDVPVNTPGVDVANTKISLFTRIIGGVKAVTGATGRGLLKLGGYFKTLGASAAASCAKAKKGLFQVLNIVLIYGGAFRAFMMFTQGVSEGLQNISQYSDETADSMNKLSTMSLYLKNSIGAALYPVIVAITPALEAMADAIIKALNAFNQFVSAWGGATTFIKAKKVLKEYGETATATANKIKKSFAGMDEITVIGNNDSGSASSSTPDYSSMFETAPISDTTSAVVENLKANLENLKAALGGAALVVGAILTFSGANVPLGLGLMVVGGYALASAATENWGYADGMLQDKFTSIMLIISGALIVVGAILAFSGAATGLGIALMIGGAATLATAVAENWEGLPNNIKNTITIIGLAVGAASLVLGTILTFTGAAIPLGIGLMIVGAAELATAAVLGWEALPNDIKQTLTIIGLAVSAALLVLGACLTFTGAAIPLGIALLVLGAAGLVATAKIGWNTMSDKVKNTISIITAILSTALLVIGIILCVTGVGIPLGVALIVLGAAGLATAVAVNWDWVKDKIKTVLSAALAIISGFGLVLGILLCLTGVGIPLGIALIFASIKGVKAASDIDDNPVTNFIKKMVNGIIGIFESGVNFIIKMLNKLSWEVPDWVPVIGGSTFGFNIKPISIPRLKDGGFPDGEDGLFYANHNELVGKFSNGRTAVANNDQIVDGIRSGVYDANQEQNNLLREQNKLLRQLLDRDNNGEINVSTITKAQSRNNRRHGKTIVPVGT
ncbi:MAG: hypothetical protein E7365_00965 [Clostridiales bacterium]|nr:hypothetical protein [Clostridiales bacterium]